MGICLDLLCLFNKTAAESFCSTSLRSGWIKTTKEMRRKIFLSALFLISCLESILRVVDVRRILGIDE